MSAASVDPQKLSELVEMTDPDFVQELIDAYLEDSPRQIREMRQALESEQADSFTRAAHSLKSTSASLGVRLLHDYAKELEQYGRAGELAPAAEHLDQLEGEFEKVKAELGRWRDE